MAIIPRPFQPPNYNEKIDFKALAQQDTDFADAIKDTNGYVDFTNPTHFSQLTKSLLRRDFGLELKLPDDRLCPGVANRWAYICWIQDLVDSTDESFTEGFDPGRKVTGLDIGVGASCIYPLLGCTARRSWRFAGTEIDQKSYEHAIHNVASNELDKTIRLLRTTARHPLLPLDELKIGHADFTMCNPPFYESEKEMMATFDKDKPPKCICTGSEVEMITEGGEAAYVSQMVTESHELADRVQWYTSQLGKIDTLPTIVAKLKSLGCHNWAVGVLMLSEAATRRWVIAWSWDDLRPINRVARSENYTRNKEVLPFPTLFHIDTPAQDQSKNNSVINTTLSALPLEWSWSPTKSSGIGWTTADVWSRAARRKQKRQKTEWEATDFNQPEKSSYSSVVLAFRIIVKKDGVEVHWLKGVDHVLWESFCGMVKRHLATPPKLEEATANVEPDEAKRKHSEMAGG